MPIVNASANQTVCANNSVVALNGTVQGGSSTGPVVNTRKLELLHPMIQL
ncbi:MAG: hypothetical protein R2779_02970 [Crocinitomicaceae bacterium]